MSKFMTKSQRAEVSRLVIIIERRERFTTLPGQPYINGSMCYRVEPARSGEGVLEFYATNVYAEDRSWWAPVDSYQVFIGPNGGTSQYAGPCRVATKVSKRLKAEWRARDAKSASQSVEMA